MKKTVYAILIFVHTVPLLFSGCISQKLSGDSTAIDSNVVQQTSAVPEEKNTPPVFKETASDGGFSKTSTESDNVKESFIFLKKELLFSYPKISLIRIQKSETQIVAGWKIRLLCEYTIDNSKGIHFLKATVYKNLAGKMTLEAVEIDIRE